MELNSIWCKISRRRFKIRFKLISIQIHHSLCRTSYWPIGYQPIATPYEQQWPYIGVYMKCDKISLAWWQRIHHTKAQTMWQGISTNYSCWQNVWHIFDMRLNRDDTLLQRNNSPIENSDHRKTRKREKKCFKYCKDQFSPKCFKYRTLNVYAYGTNWQNMKCDVVTWTILWQPKPDKKRSILASIIPYE